MTVLQRQETQPEQRHTLVIPSRVIAALDQLDPDEQASVRRAFAILERRGPAARSELDITPLHQATALFALAAAPRVRVVLRLRDNAPVEVLDIFRPEMLELLAQGW